MPSAVQRLSTKRTDCLLYTDVDVSVVYCGKQLTMVVYVQNSPVHGYGTICPLNCDSKTFASPSLGGYLRQFCFAETRRIVTSLF